MTLFGESLFSRSLWGFDTRSEAAASAIEQDAYSLELCTKTGAFTRYLPLWLSGQYTTAANKPSMLEFAYPITSTSGWADIVFPAQVRLRGKDGSIVDRFTVSAVTRSVDNNGARVLSVRCDGMLAVLAREALGSFQRTAETVGDIVGALLARQPDSDTQRISLGRVAPSIAGTTATVKRESASILAILNDMQAVVGGWFWADANGRFYWEQSQEPQTGLQIRLETNMGALEVNEDYSSIRTRVIAYGGGAFGSSSRIESIKTSGVETYGDLTHIATFPTVQDQATLDTLAENLVERLARPRKTVRVDAIDLSWATDHRTWDHAAIRTGMPVRVVDELLDETYDAHILSVARDLASPIAVTVTVGSLAFKDDEEDLLDKIIETTETVREYYHEDVQMSGLDWEDLGVEFLPIDPEDPESETYPVYTDDGVIGQASVFSLMADEGVLPVGGATLNGVENMAARVDHVHAYPSGGGTPADQTHPDGVSQYVPDAYVPPVYCNTADGGQLWTWHGGGLGGWRPIRRIQLVGEVPGLTDTLYPLKIEDGKLYLFTEVEGSAGWYCLSHYEAGYVAE